LAIAFGHRLCLYSQSSMNASIIARGVLHSQAEMEDGHGAAVGYS
jgi:hypothetical protein